VEVGNALIGTVIGDELVGHWEHEIRTAGIDNPNGYLAKLWEIVDDNTHCYGEKGQLFPPFWPLPLELQYWAPIRDGLLDRFCNTDPLFRDTSAFLLGAVQAMYEYGKYDPLGSGERSPLLEEDLAHALPAVTVLHGELPKRADPVTRQNIINLLVAIGHPTSCEVLRAVAQNDPAPEVCNAALGALCAIAQRRSCHQRIYMEAEASTKDPGAFMRVAHASREVCRLPEDDVRVWLTRDEDEEPA
jgi:hypothetical protein